MNPGNYDQLIFDKGGGNIKLKRKKKTVSSAIAAGKTGQFIVNQ